MKRRSALLGRGEGREGANLLGMEFGLQCPDPERRALPGSVQGAAARVWVSPGRTSPPQAAGAQSRARSRRAGR